MSDNDDKKSGESEIYRVDTVPPPAGEDDAYSAPTKVGPMAAVAVEDMMRQAEKKAADLAEKAAEKAKKAGVAGPPDSRASNRQDMREELGPAGAKAAPSPAQIPQAPRVPQGMPAPAAASPPAAQASPAAAAPAAQAAPAAPAEAPPAAEEPQAPVPRVSYEEDDGEENAATLLHPKAKPPVVSVRKHERANDDVLPPMSARPAVEQAEPPAAAPLPFGPPGRPVSLVPIYVGLAVFLVGLAMYLFMR